MRIIELLSRQQSGLRVREVSETLDITKSTVSRLFQEMIDAGFLEKKPNAVFVAGYRLMTVGEMFSTPHPMLADAKEVMGEITGRFGFTGFVSKLVKGQNFILDVRSGSYPVRPIARLHERRPAIDTAGGLAMLSRMGQEEVSRLIRRDAADPMLADLMTTLDTTRRRQFLYKTSTRMDGWTSVAAVLPQSVECGDLALCIAWPDAVVDSRLMAEMSEHLLRQVEALRGLA